MSQELNLNELEAAARAYPANITRTVCALLDHIRALEAGKVPEGYRLVRAELRALMQSAIDAAQVQADAGAVAGDAMTDEDLALFIKTADDFADQGETDTPDETLFRWAGMGLLECTNYTLTEDGQDIIDHAAMSREQSGDDRG